jgi:hypothetical protein
MRALAWLGWHLLLAVVLGVAVYLVVVGLLGPAIDTALMHRLNEALRLVVLGTRRAR